MHGDHKVVRAEVYESHTFDGIHPAHLHCLCGGTWSYSFNRQLRDHIEELLESQVSNVPAISDFLGKWLYDPDTFVGDEVSTGSSKTLISVKAESDRKPSSKYARDTLEMYGALIDKKRDTVRLVLSTEQFLALIKGKCRRCLAPYKKGHKCAPNAKLIKGIKDAQ